MINCYDFEVFTYDWLVVIINPVEQTETVIINDRDKLIEYYEAHKNEIWVGYNSRNYDTGILKGILCGFNPKAINDNIIYNGAKVWQIDSRFRDIHLFNYDCFILNTGLKQLEAYMGNDIRETEVPFDIPRKLTPEEIQQTVKYCRHDVEQTLEVFIRTKSNFDAQIDLIKTFKLSLNCINKTLAQLAAIILGARKKEFYDEWEIRLPETLQLDKYKFIADWFMNPVNHNYNKDYDCEIAGVPHNIAWGGLHGAIKQYNYTCKEDEMFVMADVDQLYPTLMVRYKLLSRAVHDYKKFENILATSLRLKAEKKKKEREPYKKICNITYGAEGDSNNAMYDPLHRNLVCVYGQVLVIDLIEKLEPFCELIQSNTDGILIKIKSKDFDRLDDTVYDWEQRTGLHMSFDTYKSVYQGDVNNYIIIDEDGHYKSKGGYVKELNDLDFDLPIVNEAIVKYLTEDIPAAETINNCDELKMFQKVVKVSSKYKYGWHNGEIQTDKTYRVFASTNYKDTYIGKIKEKGATIEKFANTPEHCFIENGNVNGVKVPEKLNKRWYIALAEKRLREKFGAKIEGDVVQEEFDFEEKPKRIKKQVEKQVEKIPQKRVEIKQEDKYDFDIF